MSEKCYLCHNTEATITEHPNGYHYNDVICLECGHYRVVGSALPRLVKLPDEDRERLKKEVKKYFERTGEPHEINTITVNSPHLIN